MNAKYNKNSFAWIRGYKSFSNGKDYKEPKGAFIDNHFRYEHKSGWLQAKRDYTPKPTNKRKKYKK
jgi:hypothetical protein